jgi:preprotein translocase subunit SecY
MSILAFPQTIAFFVGENSGFALFISQMAFAQWKPRYLHLCTLSAFLIIFFTYFYTAVTFNPVEIASNMKKNGGFIPGIRPGKPTSDYLAKVLNRITLAGAVFLAAIAMLPMIILNLTGMPVAFGGTALLIVVGVALETVKQIEAQMMMRHYQGFLK